MGIVSQAIAVLDVVSTAIHGDEVAMNVLLWGSQLFASPYQQMVSLNFAFHSAL